MGSLTNNIPKPLLSFGETTILTRLINQILQRYDGEVLIVVGYMKELIINSVNIDFRKRLTIIENNDYLNDINILSLSLAINESLNSFYVFEADCVYDDYAMNMIFSENLNSVSSWFSIGIFKNEQVGGISKINGNGQVQDLLIVDKYEEKYAKYNKLIGVLRVGPNEAKLFTKLIKDAANNNTKQYYHAPWIKNLDSLPCYNIDLGVNHAVAFNTAEEYSYALKLFNH